MACRSEIPSGIWGEQRFQNFGFSALVVGEVF